MNYDLNVPMVHRNSEKVTGSNHISSVEPSPQRNRKINVDIVVEDTSQDESKSDSDDIVNDSSESSS